MVKTRRKERKNSGWTLLDHNLPRNPGTVYTPLVGPGGDASCSAHYRLVRSHTLCRIPRRMYYEPNFRLERSNYGMR